MGIIEFLKVFSTSFSNFFSKISTAGSSAFVFATIISSSIFLIFSSNSK